MTKDLNSLALKFAEDKSEKSFKLLVNRLENGLKKYIFNILKDSDLTDDVYLESLTKIHSNIDQYNSYYAFGTWAYRIARNQAFQALRLKKKENISLDFVIDNITEAEGMTVDIETPAQWNLCDEEYEKYNKVMSIIKKLSPIYSDILLDREFHGLTYVEIAEKHNLNLDTVKIRILRARENVLKSL